MSNTTYTTIDLFAGIGGIRKGFEATGRFRTIYANDFDKHCKLTYDANFKNTPLTVKDIHEVGLVKDGVESFDFLLGGFPCQAFSVAGHKQGLDDHKDEVFSSKKSNAYLKRQPTRRPYLLRVSC